MSKVVMIGLDGLNPDLVELWQEELPNVTSIMKRGVYGKGISTVPPTTPQAWTCVMSGKNPGQFGFWDLTYRREFAYGEPHLANSSAIEVDTLYHILPRQGKKVSIINVPVTYPPPAIPEGFCIASFLTPGPDREFTYPVSLREEIQKVIGEYINDASTAKTDFRQMDKDVVLERIYRMDQQRFDLLRYFIKNKKCDFIFVVVMGIDRMSHLFYRYFDREHVRFTEHEKYAEALKNHYKFCDTQIGEILELLDQDTTAIVLSDHSVQRLDGRINLNEWLIREGYMTIRTRPAELTTLREADVDWSKTKAWATGYTGQIYLNLKGRELKGVVDPGDYDKLLDELAAKMKEMTDEKGEALDTVTFKRKEIHPGEYSKFGPDLFIGFDQYRWNVSELLGYDSIYSYYTTKGPDDGGHGPYGFFAMAGKGISATGEVSGITLLDIAPTVLTLMGLDVPGDMEGKSLAMKQIYSSEDEQTVKDRLSQLGYL